MKKSRSVSASILSNGLPVDELVTHSADVYDREFLWPEFRCLLPVPEHHQAVGESIRALGRDIRLPAVPAVSKNAPILAANPKQIVTTSGQICCIVS